MDELLVQYCKRLHFGSNILANAKAIIAENNIDFLTELFKRELDNREIKRKNMYIKKANFDIKKTFTDYSFEGIQIPNCECQRKSLPPNHQFVYHSRS